jgi:hypothetical protein
VRGRRCVEPSAFFGSPRRPACGGGAAVVARSDQAPPVLEHQIEQALAADAAGDDRAPARLIASRPNLWHVERVLTRDGRPWRRSTPAFVLELVAELPDVDAFRAPSLLEVGWALMVIRPTAPGVDPEDDRFEILGHQAALGLAQGLQQFWLQQDPLDLIALRFKDAPHLLPGRRIPLARAIAAAGLCCWRHAPARPCSSSGPARGDRSARTRRSRCSRRPRRIRACGPRR